MSSQTRRIPPNEWEERKGDILNFISQKGYTLKKTKDVMKTEHEFDASISQYEAQFRIWKFRKNLSKDEWAAVIEIIDKLDSQHKEFRILISGELVDPIRLQRARRMYKKEKYRNSTRTIQGRFSDLQNVLIEIRGHDGIWSPYLNYSNSVRHAQSETHRQSALPNASMVDGPTFVPNVQQESHDQAYEEIGVLDTASGPQPDLSHDFDIDYLIEYAVGEAPWLVSSEVSRLSTPMAFIQQVPQPEIPSVDDWNFGSPFLGSMIWARSPSPLYSPTPSKLSIGSNINHILDALPFKYFMKDLRPIGSYSANRSLSFNSTNSFTISSSLGHFQEDINSCLTENNGNVSRYEVPKSKPNVTDLLSSLRNQLPNMELQGVHNNRDSLMTEDEMLQVKLDEILLFSTANGFMGLEGIPIQCVLKYFRRSGNNRLLLEMNNSHVGKSLAENLFRAAIEDQDKDTLKYLLAFPSIDVNLIICTVKGQKYTPIERAANLHDLGIVKLLLEAKADVRKTYESDPLDGGPLERLIDGFGRTESATTNIIEIGKLLLDNGAELHFRAVEGAFELQNSQTLAYFLVSRVSNSNHATFIREGVLSLIATHLDDSQATQATKNIIMACEHSKCQRCKKEYERKLDWALIQAAKYGRLELAKLLLLYSKTPQRVLSAALRSNNPELIELIITLKPDFNAPAHSIDYEEDESKYESEDTTSYAEAIEARNEKLILEMEKKGALGLLHEGGRFKPAITAASRIGDIVCVRKFLECCPSPVPSHMTAALMCAINQDHEEVFNALLDAGADVNVNVRSLEFPSEDTLFSAVIRKSPSMVRAIMDADFESMPFWRTLRYKGVETTIIEQALIWGDREIIQDLISTFPSTSLRYENAQLILDSVDMAQFDFLLGCRVCSTYLLTRFLEIGLDQGNAELVKQLVDRGADPTDPRVLATCLAKYPTIVRERMSFWKGNHIIPRFGTTALTAAIKSGPTGLAAVKLLLETGFVDAKSFDNHLTPLGVAIKVVRNGHHADFEVIRSLLNYGCDPNSIVSHWPDLKIKQTAILEAIQTRSKGLVELLIDHGAEVNREAKLGLKRTPLQKAVEEDSLEIVTLLLEKGANPNAKPAQRGGATAFQLAAIRGNCIIGAKLLERGADPHAPPATTNGRWPLEGAAENGRIQMIHFLWRINGDCFNAEKCESAMKLAEGNGYMACKDAIKDLSQQMAAEPLLTMGQY